MREYSDEEVMAGAANELSDEEVLATVPKPKLTPRTKQEYSDEELLQKQNATFGTAVRASIVEGTKQAVGGMMEAAGDALRDRTKNENALTVLQGMRKGPGGIVMGASDAAREALRPKNTPEEEQFWQNLKGAGRELGDEARRQQDLNTPDDLGFWGKAAVSATGSVAQTLPWLLASRFSKGKVSQVFAERAVLGQFGGMQFGQAYNEAKAAGATPDTALETAIPSALAEVYGEKLGLDYLFKGGKNWLRNFLLGEIGGEEATTIAQSLIEKQKYNPEKWDSPDEIVYDLALTAAGAAMGAGTTGAVGKFVEKVQQNRVEQAFGNSTAKRELNEIFARADLAAQGVLPEDTPVIVDEPTPQELVEAKMLLEQRAKGLDVEVPARNRVLGDILDEAGNELRNRGITEPLGTDQDQSADEGGISAGVLARRQDWYQAPDLPMSKRPIVHAQDEGILGLTLEQVGNLPRGAVVAVAAGTQEQQEKEFPAAVYGPLVQDLKAWVDKYAPEMRVVLNLEPFAPKHQESAFGLHMYRGGVHIITPRDLPGFHHEGGDQRTSMAMVAAVAHEFGHALKMETFYQGVRETLGDELANELSRAVRKNELTDAHLALLEQACPEEAGVLRTWRDLRQSILDGQLTAQDFVDSWAGLRKLSGSVSRNVGYRKDLYTWAEERLKAAGKGLTGATAQELILAPLGKDASQKEKAAYLDEYLSFDEYMAEQFSRAAHQAGDLESGALGKVFTTALQKLRMLFRDLKSWRGENGERIIQPGETFAKWLDKQTLRAKGQKKHAGVFRRSAKLRAAQAEVRRRLAEVLEEEQELAEPESPPEQVPPPPEVVATQIDEREKLEETLDQMLHSGSFLDERDPKYVGIRGYIKRGQYQVAKEKIEAILDENLNWDREYSSRVLERLPNKQQVKVDTLKSLLKMQDVKAGERAMWEQFLLAHPEGFTLDEAQAAVANSVFPLEPQYTNEYAYYGVESVGLPQEDATTVIWNGPYESREWNHFSAPKYVMHSRRVDVWSDRYVVEMQSDLFQKHNYSLITEKLDDIEKKLQELDGRIALIDALLERGVEMGEEAAYLAVTEEDLRKIWMDAPDTIKLFLDKKRTNYADLYHNFLRIRRDRLTTERGYMQEDYDLVARTGPKDLANLQKNWTTRLIREEVAAAFEDGKNSLFFATADTVAKVEGWSAEYELPYLIGRQVPWAVPEQDDIMTGKLSKRPDGPWYLYSIVDGQETRWELNASGHPAMAEILEKAKNLKATYGKRQGIYQRYKSEVQKFLKSQYGAKEVTLRGETWLSVDPREYGSKILNWDRDNPLSNQALPQAGLADFAGMTVEDYRKPEVVAEASDMWNRLGFESPYWKRWGGNTKVVGNTGEPLRVWRGQGGRITFLDKSGMGGSTGAQSGKKAFWFTDNKENAQFYAESGADRKRTVKPEFRREQQAVRTQLEEARSLRREASREHWPVLDGRIERLRERLDRMQRDEEMSEVAAPMVQGFYLNMVNPLVVDMERAIYRDKEWTQVLDQAKAAGHDGVIMKNAHDPMLGTMYAIFEPEQAKLESNIGTFDPTDELHWDQDSPTQQSVRGVSKLMQNFWEKGKLRTLNTAAKAMDGIIQLQQLAAGQPEDYALQSFYKLTQLSLKMKNNLQVDAEETTKQMMRLNGASPETINTLKKVMEAEFKSDALRGMLVGVAQDGTVVWGGEAGTSREQMKLVQRWEIHDSMQLRSFLKEQGVDVESEQGERVIDLYLRIRNVLLRQWQGLEYSLQTKARTLYEESPSILKTELFRINELVMKLRASPYLPQGRFGNYVLMLQKKEEGKRGFQTIRVEHFERKEDWQIAAKRAQAMVRNQADMRVQTRELDESTSKFVPMQLPKEMLEMLASSGMFEDGQLETLSDLMLATKYDKLEARYAKFAQKVDGANEDFVRTFADFTLRNSNFIWKLHFGTALRGAIAVANTRIRQLDRAKNMDPGEQMALVDRLRRNVRVMENSLNYMLYPPVEFQTARLWITMAYLAFNAKTALMNASTQLNTWAAVTSLYGELAGSKHYAEALRYTAGLPWLGSQAEQAEGADKAKKMGLLAAYSQAVADGVVDQSYAYFLAGQANGTGLLRSVRNSWMGKAGHAATELGMWPFRLVEKGNRISTLFTFYLAEREKGSAHQVAYETAVKQVNLLQNSYDAANKPELLRGKKSILFMFASFTQHQGWILTGGYERAMRAQARADGREVPSIMRGPTVKLWILYAMLGGLMGMPFGENVMDLLQFMWRKLFGKTENIEHELRELVKDLGADPNLVMHGLLHNAGGFDLSGSFGFGRVLPLDLLNKEYRKPEEQFGKMALSFAGPAGGFYGDLAAAIGQWRQGEFRKGFMEMPGAVGAISKALDAHLRQSVKPSYGITTKSGMRLTWDDSRGEFRDLTTGELVGMALGANTTLVSENRERYYAVQGEVLYWQTRRSGLLDRYWQAVRTGDEEARLNVREDVTRFNQKLPDRKLYISGKDLAQTVKDRRKAGKAMERFSVNGKKYRRLAQDIREDY
jgi:hypothetical protein